MKTATWRDRLSIRCVVAAIVTATAVAWSTGAEAQQPPASVAQTSVERGVTVKVIPKRTGPSGDWEFAVVLDTHSAELDDDLVRSSVLVADAAELRAVSWTGAGPGGHHREGLLRFPAPQAAPKAVELRILRSGEATPRVFRWDGETLR
jgi:hypothetical protein